MMEVQPEGTQFSSDTVRMSLKFELYVIYCTHSVFGARFMCLTGEQASENNQRTPHKPPASTLRPAALRLCYRDILLTCSHANKHAKCTVSVWYNVEDVTAGRDEYVNNKRRKLYVSPVWVLCVCTCGNLIIRVRKRFKVWGVEMEGNEGGGVGLVMSRTKKERKARKKKRI